MRENRIQRCNCMVRYNGGPPLPAIRSKKTFTDPEGNPIVAPTSYEDMPWQQIKKILAESGNVYVGHIFNARPN